MKFLNILPLSNLISWTFGKLVLIEHEHLATLEVELYCARIQSSSHKVIFLSIKSFFLSDRDTSVPLSEVVFVHISL